MTCPWDANVNRSHAFKEGKYAPLVADLSGHFKPYLFSIEISVRGQVTGANKNCLKAFVHRLEPGITHETMVEVCLRVAFGSASFSAIAHPVQSASGF